MKTLLIPDVHGELELLELALKNHPEHNYVFLGDLIDRGDNSRDCIRKAVELAEAGKAKLILGNHEIMALMAIKNPKEHRDWWYRNGGFATMSSYDSDKDFKMDLEHYLELAHHYLIEDDRLYAHAAVPTLYGGTVIGEDHLWQRPQDGFYNPTPHGINFTFHGHTPVPSPTVIKPDGITSRYYFDLGMGQLAVYDVEISKFKTYGVGT